MPVPSLSTEESWGIMRNLPHAFRTKLPKCSKIFQSVLRGLAQAAPGSSESEAAKIASWHERRPMATVLTNLIQLRRFVVNVHSLYVRRCDSSQLWPRRSVIFLVAVGSTTYCVPTIPAATPQCLRAVMVTPCDTSWALKHTFAVSTSPVHSWSLVTADITGL